MAVDGLKLNLFSNTQAMQGIKATTLNGGGNARAGGGSASKNPFGGENKFGVGLVNSDLAGMSYRLRDGKETICNTIGIA